MRFWNQVFNRDCTVLALGGGVIGDMAGFCISLFPARSEFLFKYQLHYYLKLIQVWVGRTGINHPLGKKYVGCVFSNLKLY